MIDKIIRERQFKTLQIQTDKAAPDVPIMGIKLRDMTDNELRIAAYWLVGRINGGFML